MKRSLTRAWNCRVFDCFGRTEEYSEGLDHMQRGFYGKFVFQDRRIQPDYPLATITEFAARRIYSHKDVG